MGGTTSIFYQVYDMLKVMNPLSLSSVFDPGEGSGFRTYHFEVTGMVYGLSSCSCQHFHFGYLSVFWRPYMFHIHFFKMIYNVNICDQHNYILHISICSGAMNMCEFHGHGSGSCQGSQALQPPDVVDKDVSHCYNQWPPAPSNVYWSIILSWNWN